MEGPGYLPLPTNSLSVHVYANRKRPGQVRLHERIMAVVARTVQGSLTAGACELVPQGQRGARPAATRHPAMPRWQW